MDRATKLTNYSLLMSDQDSMSGFTPAADLARYEALDIPKAGTDVKVSLYARSIEQTLADLRRIRAEPGRLPALDAAVDRAIPPMQRLLTRMRGLESYYATRGPLTDDLARGRKEHPLLIADYRAVIAAWGPVQAAYQAARDEKLVRDAAFYRREGRMAEYYDVVLVQKATQLARTIDSAEAARDADLAAEADRMVDELLDLLQRARAAHDTAAQDPNTATMVDKGIPENIEQMIGAWRDLRRTPDADHHEMMMRPYGSAMRTMALT
jgi:hypothetical protein